MAVDKWGFPTPELQVQHDEALARALQQELDNQFHVSTTMPTPTPKFQFPQDTELDTSSAGLLQAYGRELLSTRCGKCGASYYGIDGQTVINRCKSQFSARHPEIHPFFKCEACRLLFCIGCGKYGRTISDLTPSTPHEHNWCCDKGRVFLLFSLLCGPNDVPPNPQAAQPSALKSTSTSIRERLRPLEHKIQTGATPLPQNVSPHLQVGGWDYNPNSTTVFSKGTGYGGHGSWAGRGVHRQPPKITVKKGRDPSEMHLESYFKALSTLLPDPHRRTRTGFDLMDQPLISAMVMRSPMMPAALRLLHNDCMEEIAERVDLYDSLISFITTLDGHHGLSTSLFSRQRLWPPHQQLVSLTFSQNVQSSGPVETTGSVASALAKLGESCRFYHEKAAKHISEPEEAEGSRVRELTVRIFSLAESQADVLQEEERKEHLAAASNQPPEPEPISSVRTRAGRLKEDRERAATEISAWNEANRVLDVPDEQFWDRYSFKQRALALKASSVGNGRMKALARQLASLRSGLPDGIFVRHASSRLDAFKVLFVGPSDTPYENGLFEFDFFCPAKFPNDPPEALFRTTGGGTVGFNPNLYSNGKVCLSLLNTWSGQKWTPGVSTLLQVMVSIQAMIFVERPYYNEPGLQGRVNHAQSQNYNRRTQKATITHAMTYWLTDRLGTPARVDKGKAPAKEPVLAKATTSVQASGSATGANALPLSVPPYPLFGAYGTPLPKKGPPSDIEVIAALQKHQVYEKKQLEHRQQTKEQKKTQEVLEEDQVLEEGPTSVELAAQIIHNLQKPGTSSASLYQSLHALMGVGSAFPLTHWFQSPKVPETTPTPPISNTVANRIDDSVWGPVIRWHFSHRGRFILEQVRGWEKDWGRMVPTDGVRKTLEDRLKDHKFI